MLEVEENYGFKLSDEQSDALFGGAACLTRDWRQRIAHERVH